jgi:inositol-pentakisphosphate 2-kinase
MVPFCPLDLLYCREDDGAMDRVLCELQHHALSSPQRARLVDWLKTNKLLLKLRNEQCKLDPKEPLTTDMTSPRFAKAMTLRDCTLFLRIPLDPSEPMDAKLGDLDRKDPKQKEDHWRNTEQELRAFGCYMGTEQPRQRTDCSLLKLHQATRC